nr:CorA family divalent cation transporter [Nannocystis sp.]
MNFDIMPELRWTYGDPFAVGLMVITAAGLLIWFRRRHWLQSRQERRSIRRRDERRRGTRQTYRPQR